MSEVDKVPDGVIVSATLTPLPSKFTLARGSPQASTLRGSGDPLSLH